MRHHSLFLDVSQPNPAAPVMLLPVPCATVRAPVP